MDGRGIWVTFERTHSRANWQQETLNYWKQLTHVLKYFRTEEDPRARLPANFISGFLEVCEFPSIISQRHQGRGKSNRVYREGTKSPSDSSKLGGSGLEDVVHKPANTNFPLPTP
jgi:hypothetical protein